MILTDLDANFMRQAENPNADFFLPTFPGTMSSVWVNGHWLERLSKLYSWHFLLFEVSAGSTIFSLKDQFIVLYFILVFYYCWRPMRCISNILVITVFKSTTTLSTTITQVWHKRTIVCNVYTIGVISLFPSYTCTNT